MGLLGQGVMRIIVSAEVREAVAGLKAVSQTTKETATEIEKVNVASKDTATGLSQIVASANAAKNALSSIGVGLAATAAVAGIALLVEGIENYIEHAKEAAKIQKDLNTALDNGAGDAQKETSQIQALGSIIFDETNKREDRLKAFKKLQAEYPGYFGNLDLEKSSLQDIQIGLDKVTAALVRQAQIKGLEGAISDIFKKEAEFFTKDVLGQTTTFDKIKALFSAGIGPTGNNSLRSLFDSATEHGQQFGKEIDALQKKLTDLIKTGLEQDDDLLHPKKFKAAKPLKEEIPLELSFINPDLAVQNEDLEDELSKALDQLDKKIFEKFKKIQVVKIPPPELDFDAKELLKKINAIEQQLKNLIAGSVEGLAEGIGDAISGGGFKSIISSFGQVIGEGLKTIGKILIEAAIAKIAIDKAAKALATANPALGIIAGIAAIAAGTIIENEAKQAIGATKFATGGIITGPTLGLVGEAGPEVIFPLEKLNQFIKGANTSNNVNVGGELRVSGSSLVTVLNRQNKLNGLSS